MRWNRRSGSATPPCPAESLVDPDSRQAVTSSPSRPLDLAAGRYNTVRQTFGSPNGVGRPSPSGEGFGDVWHLVTFECRRELGLLKGRRSCFE